MLYFSEAYTDYLNDNKIPAQLDLNLSLNYKLFRKFQLTLDFENLLNDKYYYFRNYKAKPIDILFGFEFRW
jgi:outer membrane receptor protein involved in Fe transport